MCILRCAISQSFNNIVPRNMLKKHSQQILKLRPCIYIYIYIYTCIFVIAHAKFYNNLPK